MGRIGAALGFCLVLAGLAAARADPFTIPFELKPGAFLHFTVEHVHRDSIGGRPLPEVRTRCSVRISADTADKTSVTVLVHAESTDLTVDGERGPAPDDLRSLLLLSIDTLVARVQLSAAGVPMRVTNWQMLRDTIRDRAEARAASDPALAETASAYIASLDEASAATLLAEPLALAAAGRSATFDLPSETLIVRGSLALPSFLPSLWSEWAFQFADDPPSPDVVTVDWEGVLDKTAMAPLLPEIAREIGALTAAADPDLSEQAAYARQVFRADYANADGRLVALHGELTLTAGPLVRSDTIDIKAVP